MFRKEIIMDLDIFICKTVADIIEIRQTIDIIGSLFINYCIFSDIIFGVKR